VHEIVEVDAKIRRMVAEQSNIEDIQRYCVDEKGMQLISDEIKRLIADGTTTMAEYMRIAPTLG
jgi:type II secretory ATPase GspE/PulE/Tfp pilus assembly ATPase PilB-like protein